MFNISFSNKTQLKINFFFILLDRTRFNAFLALNRTGPAGTVEHHCSLKKTHEQWSMLHCSWVFQLKKQQIAASCNPVAMPQLIGGPTSRILLLEYYQTGELLWLLQTQKQPRNQTPSKSMQSWSNLSQNYHI